MTGDPYIGSKSGFTTITCHAAFSDVVDCSAILIDLSEAPGWLMSELDQFATGLARSKSGHVRYAWKVDLISEH
jgi:hypothetical protein